MGFGCKSNDRKRQVLLYLRKILQKNQASHCHNNRDLAALNTCAHEHLDEPSYQRVFTLSKTFTVKVALNGHLILQHILAAKHN